MKKNVLFSASLFHALDDAATVIVPMAFPILYSQQFIIHKYYHIGILSNLGLLTTLIFQVFIAYISDKFEYRFMLLLSYLGICLSLVLIPFSSSFASLLFLYLLLRVFASFYHPIGIAWVSKTHPMGGIDFAMGVQSGSGNLGVFVAFISTGYIAQKFNWKLPLLIWAIIAFFLGMASFLAVRRISSKSEELHNPDWSSWIEIAKKIKFYILGFSFGGAGWATTIYFAPSLFHHKFHVSMGQTGLYLAFWIGIGTVVSYLFGTLSKHIGRFRICLIAILGSSLSLLLIGMAPLKEVAVVGLLLFGGFLFLIYPVFQSFIGNEVKEKNQAQAFSLASNSQMLSGALIALGAGFLSDKFGINSPFLLMGILGVLIFLFYYLKRAKS
jgi:MFS family permease